MSAPFYKFDLFSAETSLVVAFLLGIGFGFFLERAGFGSARKLVAQFYLKDLAVFKVMFTAIVTAGLGVFYLSWAGFLDLSLLYISPTRLAPQIVGGLVLGAGFVIGGYCPGTSLVGIATGRLDAILFVVGVTLGIVGFGLAYPVVESFFFSTDLGAVTLPEALSLPYGMVLFGVVLMALAGFVGAEAVERWSARREGGEA